MKSKSLIFPLHLSQLLSLAFIHLISFNVKIEFFGNVVTYSIEEIAICLQKSAHCTKDEPISL